MGRQYLHWSEAEVTALKEGVQRFGVGNWQKIVNDFPVLRQRTGVQLKDKVRLVAGCGCRVKDAGGRLWLVSGGGRLLMGRQRACVWAAMSAEAVAQMRQRRIR